MNKKLVFGTIAISMLACATPKPVYLPDGRQGFAIDCSDNNFAGAGWNACYSHAGKACGARGYDIISRQGNQQSSAFGNAYGMSAGTREIRELVVACK
jgi:hypothetical protein